MKFLLSLLLFLAGLSPVRGQQLAYQETQEEKESSGKYLLFKASFNYSAAGAIDRKIPVARLEMEAPVHRDVVHAGLVVLPALVQPGAIDQELKIFWGVSGGIHFPFNKVLDPSDRFVWTGIKPFMRGYATIHTGSEGEEAEYSNTGTDWLFYAAYDIGVDWTLIRLGDCKIGLSAFNTNLKYWNFGLVLRLE